jgi:nitrogen fixation/metabolism regulation signal transduction histidine kinase
VKGLAGVRGRLLAAFLLVAVPPLLLLALAVNALLSRTFERDSERRLAQATSSATAELDRLREQARQRVAAAADLDLSAAEGAADGDRALADEIARRRDLEVLELVDADGRVVSSHHWPAGFGLADRDTLFGTGAFRVERAAEGYGARDRLTLTAERRAEWLGAPLTVRGGYFADGELLQRLSSVMGVEVGLRDEVRGVWYARPDSPLAAWSPPASPAAGAGEVRLAGQSFRVSGTALEPGLRLVIATPRASLLAITGGVRRLGLAVAAVAALLAVTAAVVLSARIARPVRDLASAARAVAAGDTPPPVPAAGADEIAELARAFTAMTGQLRESRERLLQAERVAAWREMARRLAHELKNPIFPIQLSIETLRRVLDRQEAGAEPPDFGRMFLDSSETILEELRSLRRIIDEFSDFARMPRPRLAPVDVNAVVERALDLYRPRADAVVVETEASYPLPPVNADADQLARALGNLIGNALDAMPDGGRLRVRTAAAAGTVTVEVADSGPGLTEDQKTRLFTPYFTTKKGGTGLGLAIVQGIVSDHGGRIQVRSEPGQGTAFTLLLPVSEATQGAEPNLRA